MSDSTFILKIVTETNKKFILTIENSTTMNMLIKLIKKYYAFYFKKKYFIEHILTEDKFIIFDNHLTNKFFSNGDVCFIKGKEAEDCEQDCTIENKIKYDVFLRKRNKEQINDGENKKIKQNEESSYNKNTRNFNIKSGINPKLIIKKTSTPEKKVAAPNFVPDTEINKNLDKNDKQNCENDKSNKLQNNKFEAKKNYTPSNFFDKCNLENNPKSINDNYKNKLNEEKKEKATESEKTKSSALFENIKKNSENEDLFATETINNNFKSVKHEITNLKKIKKTNKINYDDL